MAITRCTGVIFLSHLYRISGAYVKIGSDLPTLFRLALSYTETIFPDYTPVKYNPGILFRCMSFYKSLLRVCTSSTQSQMAERMMPRPEFNTKFTISSRNFDSGSVSWMSFTALVTLRSLRYSTR